MPSRSPDSKKTQMTFLVSSRGDSRHLGNMDNLEVHGLSNEDERPEASPNREMIAAAIAVHLSPDTLAHPHSDSFDKCSRCIEGQSIELRTDSLRSAQSDVGFL